VTCRPSNHSADLTSLEFHTYRFQVSSSLKQTYNGAQRVERVKSAGLVVSPLKSPSIGSTSFPASPRERVIMNVSSVLEHPHSRKPCSHILSYACLSGLPTYLFLEHPKQGSIRHALSNLTFLSSLVSSPLYPLILLLPFRPWTEDRPQNHISTRRSFWSFSLVDQS